MEKRKFGTILVKGEKTDLTILAELLAEKIRKGALNNGKDEKRIHKAS